MATKRSRRPIFLSDEALAAGERLSAASGLSMLELVEALLGVNPDEPLPAPPPDRWPLPSPPNDPPRPKQRLPGRVIPIERALARRSRVGRGPDGLPGPLELPMLLELSRVTRARAKALCKRSVDLREKSVKLAAVSGVLLRAEPLAIWATV